MAGIRKKWVDLTMGSGDLWDGSQPQRFYSIGDSSGKWQLCSLGEKEIWLKCDFGIQFLIVGKSNDHLI